MKRFLLIVVILAVIAGAVAFFLKATTPKKSEGIRFPLTPRHRALLASVPANAQEFALIPTAAVVRQKLIANPITRGPLLEWAGSQHLPRSWMIGGGDLVVWRSGKTTSYAVHLDPFRAAVVRLYLMLGAGLDSRLASSTFLINTGAANPLGGERLDKMLAATNGFETADVIMVQQGAARGAFPPIARPAITALRIGAKDIEIRSVAPVTTTAATPPTTPKFPERALVAATFREPPRIVSDLDRLFIARVSQLLDDGGSLVLYDVNPGTLLPRPDGIIVANATDENRATVKKIESAVRTFGEIKDTGEQILLSFDKDSMGLFATDTFASSPWPSNDWAARVDPRRAVPLLRRLGDNTGLRIGAPRIYRAARDLRRWIEYLSAADSIDAAHSYTPAGEELRVRIASK